MFKHASQFLAANPALGVRASQEHVPVPPPWAVVAFRRGRDNRRRPRVYRRVWAFEREDHAQRQRMKLDPADYERIALVRDGVPVGSTGTTGIVDEWVATRQGVNRGADPWFASGYMVREGHGPETYKEARR